MSNKNFTDSKQLLQNFQDKEDKLYARDVTNPTLEDHFNKTVFPKVMQVC